MSDDVDLVVPISKKPWLAINVLTKVLENRYHDYNIDYGNIVFGKSFVGDEFVKCGLIKLFNDIGILLLLQLTDAYYLALVQKI